MKKENLVLGICSLFLLVIFGKMLKTEWVDIEKITSKKQLIRVLKKEKNTSHFDSRSCRGIDDGKVLRPAVVKTCEGVSDISSGRVLSPSSLKSSTGSVTSSSSSKVSENFSKTNVQEEGIDEGDTIKTDGAYFYEVSDKKVTKLDLKGKVKKSISFGKGVTPEELYVDKKNVIVIGKDDVYTFVNIYDKKSMKKQQELKMEGSALGVRKINDKMYVVIDKEINGYNDYSLPEYKDSVSTGKKEINFNDFHYGTKRKLDEYITIYAFSTTKKEPVHMSTFLGSGNGIYMSDNAIYLTATEDSDTVIHKFAIDKENVSFERIGKVTGRTLNQFSMDEYKDNIRIATTDGTGNYIHVLNEKLKPVGSVEKLAIGEQIKSVRFMGDKGYVVTFKEVDPLFTLDLKDPTHPIVKGELKIPGYSSYLHPYDNHHLIGFGVDEGIKISLFDVENMRYPVEEFSEIFGDSSTKSSALENHHAFFFSKEDNLVGFPLSGINNSSYYILMKINKKTGMDVKRIIKLSSEEDEPRTFYIGKKLYIVSNGKVQAYDRKTLEKKNAEKID